MRLTLPVLTIIVCLLSNTKVQAQWKQPLEQIRSNLDSFYQYNPSEKCFLLTDKDWYFPGETIWFRTFLTVDDAPGELSRVIYVDLSDDSGKVIAKSMWKNELAGNRGDLYLPQTMPPGFYRLRAYTLYMLNTPTTIFEKIIRVTDGVTPFDTIATDKHNLYLKLQPEGGALLAELENKIGYYVYNENGIPVAGAFVAIKNNAQQIVATDTANAYGFGKLEFTPKADITYTATVEAHNRKKELEIARAIKTGVQIRTSIGPSRIFISLNTLSPQQYPTVLLLAQMNGVLVYAQEYPLEEGVASGAIDTRKLPEGILEITCLSKQAEIVATRSVFVQRSNTPIRIHNNNFPQPKAPMEIQISGLPDSSLVAVSVTDAEPVWLPQHAVPYPTYVWMSTAISGYKGPGNPYFQRQNMTIEQTDLLLLVFGQSRFSMQDILSGRMPSVNYLPETGIQVQGAVASSTPIPKDSRLSFIIKTEDSTTLFTEAQILGNNRFAVGNLDFRKQARLYVKENSSRTGNTSITIEPGYIDTLQRLTPITIVGNQKIKTAAPKKTISTDTALQRFQYGKRQANELQEIIITGKTKSKEEQLTEQYATEQFRQSEFTLVPDSTIAYASIWQYLLANIAGLQVNGDFFTQPEVHFTRYTALRNFSNADATFVEDVNSNRSSIAFYLNEVLVPIESITDLNPKDIALIKVNRNPNMGLNAPLGSIAIYTRKGSWWDRGAFSRSVITGYNTSRVFYSPQYNRNDATLSTNDLRTTLFWNPAVPIKNGTATIRFFNNDVSKRLKVVICGMDTTGRPIYAEKIME